MSLELFRKAATLSDVSSTTLANLGLLERELGNFDLSFRYLTRAAAMNDPSASFWLGEALYLDFEYSRKNDSQSFVHYQSVIRRHIMRDVWTKAFDCFLARNFACSIWHFSLSGAIGHCESSFDLATMLTRNWDQTAVPIPNRTLTVRNVRPKKRWFCFFFFRLCSFQLYLDAVRNYHYQSDVVLGDALLNLGKLAANETEAMSYFHLAMDRNSSEAKFYVAGNRIRNGNISGGQSLAIALCGKGFAETIGCVVLIGQVFWKSALAIGIMVAIAIVAALKYD